MATDILKCGLSKKQILVQADSDLQEVILRITSNGSGFTRLALDCVARVSLRYGYYVTFSSREENSRYQTIYSQMEAVREQATARIWLAQRRMLSRLPTFHDGNSLAAYAEDVERFCGVAPRSLLAIANSHMITFRPTAFPMHPGDRIASGDELECVTNTMTAANIQLQGVLFGFVGNEATISPAQ